MISDSTARITASTNSFYGMLSQAARDRLQNRAAVRIYQPSTVMMREGEPAAYAMVLLEGMAKADFVTDLGQRSVLRIYLTGDVLGSEAALMDQPRSESVTTLVTCRCLVVPASQFAALLAADPEIARVLSLVMTQRLRAADERAKARLASPNVRLARVLLTLADQVGVETPAGISVPVELSQEELASWIDVSRSTIARMLADLRTRGLVHTSYRKITITDPRWLRQIAVARS